MPVGPRCRCLAVVAGLAAQQDVSLIQLGATVSTFGDVVAHDDVPWTARCFTCCVFALAPTFRNDASKQLSPLWRLVEGISPLQFLYCCSGVQRLHVWTQSWDLSHWGSHHGLPHVSGRELWTHARITYRMKAAKQFYCQDQVALSRLMRPRSHARRRISRYG